MLLSDLNRTILTLQKKIFRIEDILCTCCGKGAATFTPQARNGTNITLSKYVELGGPLLHDTDIDFAGFNLSLTNVPVDYTATSFLALNVDGKVVIGLPASQGIVSADNALTLDTPTNVQLGGPLIHDTTIDLDAHNFMLVNVNEDLTVKRALVLDGTDRLLTSRFVESVTQGLGIVVDNTDPYNPIVSSVLTPVNLKSVVDVSLVTYFDLPRNFDTDDIIGVTYSGAMATAVITPEESYDRFDVTGGLAATSFMTFNDYILTDSTSTIIFTVKVNSLKTDPLIGIVVRTESSLVRLNIAGDVSSIFYPNLPGIDANIATGHFSIDYDYNSGGTPFVINNGDILEIMVERHLIDSVHWKMQLINKTTRTFITRYGWDANVSNTYNSAAHVGVVLADGDYTILGYKVLSGQGKNPKVCLVGDASATGFNQEYSDTILAYLEANLFYRTAILGGGFNNAFAAAYGSSIELLALQPESVFLIDSQSIQSDFANVANGSHAAFETAMQVFADCVNSFRGFVYFTMIPTNTPSITPSKIVTYNAWVLANAAAYGAGILDLTAIPITPEAIGGFFWGPPTTQLIGQAIIDQMTLDGTLP